MEEHPIRQSARSRAWEDTKKSFSGLKFFWGVEVGLMIGLGFLGDYLIPEGASRFVSAAYPTVGAVAGAIGGFGIIYLIMLITAPIKQRNEARAKVIALEKEKEPCIEVHPFPCKRASYERSNNTAWAALKVKNTSSEVDLENVSVQILELVGVAETQDGQGVGTGRYILHEPYPRWTPANVYWAESNATAKTFEITIKRGDTKLALIAFHWENGPALGVLNTPTYPNMLESRIVITISSTSMNTWQGIYYIEYHPQNRDEFEFIEWDLWRESHNVVEKSTFDKGDSQD